MRKKFKKSHQEPEYVPMYGSDKEKRGIKMNIKSDGNIFIMFEGIAEKEMLMYQAVIAMIQEDYDINSIKVSDITSRAGIGKGTAYEYFSSKEEIIVKALLFDTYSHLKRIEGILREENAYKNKLFMLFDYLEEHLPHTKGVGSLLKMFSGTFEIKEDIKKELEKIQSMDACPITYVENLIDNFMVQGLEEKLYIEQDVILRRSVFATQLTGYIYCIINHFYNGGISKDAAREFAYACIVKLLNP